MLTKTIKWMTTQEMANVHSSYSPPKFEHLYDELGIDRTQFTIRVMTPYGYGYSADCFGLSLFCNLFPLPRMNCQWDIIAVDLLHRNQSTNFVITINHNLQHIPIAIDYDCAEVMLNIKIAQDYSFQINGQSFASDSLRAITRNFDFTLESLYNLLNKISIRDPESLHILLSTVLAENPKIFEIHPSGATKLYAQLLPLTGELAEKDPVAFCWFRTLCASCKRTIDSVKVSSVFNADFAQVKTVDELIEALKPLTKSNGNLRHYYSRYGVSNDFADNFKNFPTFAEKRKAAIKATSHRAFSKLMQEYEFLNLDEKKFPRTKKAIEEGILPLGIFFRKKEQYFLLNDNFELWEKMLKLWPDETAALAKTATGRTTYEKDLMSYFYFILYALPEYLKRHTGKKWTCIPKLVNSSSELNPPTDDGSGTVRNRFDSGCR